MVTLAELTDSLPTWSLLSDHCNDWLTPAPVFLLTDTSPPELRMVSRLLQPCVSMLLKTVLQYDWSHTATEGQ